MIFLDELDPLRIYSRTFYLPIYEKDKYKGSAVFLLNPNYKSINSLIKNKLFTHQYFSSYYIEKDITYIINNEGFIDLDNDIPYNVLTEEGKQKTITKSVYSNIVKTEDHPLSKYLDNDTEYTEILTSDKTGINKALSENTNDNSWDEFCKSIKSPIQLSNWIKRNLKYSRNNDLLWKLNSPEQTFIERKGQCFDQAYFIYYFLEKMNLNPKLYYCKYFKSKNDKDAHSHTFVTYEENNIIYYFDNHGIQEKFISYKQFKNFLLNKYYRRLKGDKSDVSLYLNPLEVSNLHDGMSFNDFTNIAQKNMNKDEYFDKLPLNSSNESHVEKSNEYFVGNLQSEYVMDKAYLQCNNTIIAFNENLYEDQIITEADERYNNIIRKILYNERYKNNKEIFEIYNKIKANDPFIKNTFISYDRYKQKNLLIDLSYYNQTFFKNNMYKLDKGVELYFDFITRFIRDKRVDKAGYTQKTVMIPIMDWNNEEYKIYNFNKDINPISMIYRMMQKNLFKIKDEWKDLLFIFYSDSGYFSVDFNTIETSDIVKFKTLIDKLINKDFIPEDKTSNEDSKKAIKSLMISKIEDFHQVKIYNLTGDSKDVNKNELIKKIDNAAIKSNTLDDALDNLEIEDKKNNDEFKKLLVKIIEDEDDAVKLNAVRKSRVSKLQDEFMDKKIGDKTIKELIGRKRTDEPLPKTSLELDTINEEWEDLSYVNFEKAYDVNSDILKILDNLSKLSVPVNVRDISVDDTSTSEDYLDTYTVKCEDVYGKRFTLKFDVPKLIDNKFFMLRGNEKTINGQEMLLPIEKTDEDTVQIVSNYKKIFIRRFGKSKGKSFIKADLLLKALNKVKDPDIKISYGDNTLICSKYELPIDYIDIASVISKIETRNIIVYFNQDEIREKYPDKIDKNKDEIPFIYHKPTKKILHYEPGYSPCGLVIDHLVGDSNEFAKVYQDIKPGKKYTYSKASILSNEIPLIVIMAYNEGLIKAMNKANIKYTIEEKRRRPNTHMEDIIKFKDGYIYYDIDYNSSLLMNGLKECNTEDYSLLEINNKKMYLDFLDMFGGRLLADGLDNFYDLMIDPITKEVLEYYDLPLDYVSVLAYANGLLADNKYIRHTDMSGKRYRSNEIIAGYVYQSLADAYGDYRNSLRKNRQGSTMTIKQTAVLDKILLDPTASDASTLNPLLELENINAVSPKGLAGMNNDRSYSLDKRTYDDSMLGILGLSTGFAGNVGITRQAVIDMNVYGKRGYFKIDKDPNKLSVTKAFTATEAVTPFGSTRDDPFRSAMTFIQTAKHQMRTKVSHPMLISNGMDQALPYMITNKFAFKAKSKGKVIEKTDEYMVIKYDNNTHDFIDLREVVKKNSDGGFFVTLKLDSDLKIGSSVKPNQIVAYDKDSFSDIIGFGDNLAYNIGTICKVAMLNTDEGYEDSSIISEYLSEAMSSDVVTMVPVTLDKNTNIYNMAKVGDHVEEGDSLLVFQNAFEDNDVNILLKNLVDDEESISELGRIPKKSKVTGVIQDIKIYRSVEKNELSDSLRKEVNKIEKPLNDLTKVLNKYDVDFKNRYNVNTLDTTGKLKNAKDSVLIEFYIKYHDKLSIGDKIIYYSALKGVNKEIFPLGKEPFSDYRKDEKIHSLLSLGSVSARMVCSVKIVGGLQKFLIELDRHVKDKLGIKWKYLDEM